MLPALAPGVMVHFNDAFEILLPAQNAVAREHPDRLAAVVPSFQPPPGHPIGLAAFWICRR